MTQEQYKRKCDALFSKAKGIGVELSFHPESFNPDKLNCLWYGGYLADIKVTDTLSVELNIYGDVYPELADKNSEFLAYVKDKGNTGRFNEEMSPYIQNDQELLEALDDGRLKLDYNNWVEYDGIIKGNALDKCCTFIDLGIICDNILDDDIITAIEQALDTIEEIKAEIVSVAERHYGIKAVKV